MIKNPQATSFVMIAPVTNNRDNKISHQRFRLCRHDTTAIVALITHVPAIRSDLPDIQFTDSVAIGWTENRSAPINGIKRLERESVGRESLISQSRRRVFRI